MRRGLSLIALACAIACNRGKKTESVKPVLTVEVAGCAATVEGPSCELPKDRVLRVFVPGGTKPTFQVDGHVVEATELRTFSTGILHRVVLPEGATALVVEKESGRFVLTLAHLPAYPWVLEARALRGKDPEAARAKAGVFVTSTDPIERALALGLIARVDLGRGKIDEAIAGLREAVALQHTRISDHVEDAFALAFALSERRGRFVEAGAVLDAVEPHLAGYPEGRARLPFYRAELAIQAGDVRASLRGLQASRTAAEHLGMVRLERNARGLLATLEQDLGHVEEGIAALRALHDEITRDPQASACESAETLLNLALSIERRDVAKRDLGEPIRSDELSAPANGAKSLFPERCTDPYLHGIALGVSAAAALARNQADEASTLAKQARALLSTPRPIDLLQMLDLEARIATAQGKPREAIEKHSAAIEFAEASQQTDMLWRALVGRGDAREAISDDEGALEDYRRAELLLEDVTLAIPLGEARGLYLSRSEASARRAITLLVRKKREAEAFEVTRRARARLFSTMARTMAVDSLAPKARTSWDAAVTRFRAQRLALDEAARDDWKLSAPALRDARALRATTIASVRASLDDAIATLGIPRRETAPRRPRQNELFLALGRSRVGFVGFAVTDKSVRVAAITGDAGEALIRTFDGELAVAKKLFVLAYGPLRGVDLHAATFRDAPLVDAMPVSYLLDVPASGTANTGDTIGIVADPTDDLPASRAEAKSLEDLFKGRSLRVLRGTEAKASDVLALFDVGLFHYAGHAVFGGADGFESRLPLAGGSQLGLLDVLASPRVPRRVVLSACESSKADSISLVETLGLAQAFVIAGSEGVVAPTRKIPDALAARLSIALHRALLEPGVELSEALRRAQRQLRDEPDWAAFRALER